jgi:hypothetical protein
MNIHPLFVADRHYYLPDLCCQGVCFQILVLDLVLGSVCAAVCVGDGREDTYHGTTSCS